MTAERAPDWATKEADKLLGIGWGNQNQGIRATLSDDIARALVEAERRGLEAERKRCAGIANERAAQCCAIANIPHSPELGATCATQALEAVLIWQRISDGHLPKESIEIIQAAMPAIRKLMESSDEA